MPESLRFWARGDLKIVERDGFRMTTGQILFYGGIAGTVLFAVLFVVTWVMFEKKKKKLMGEIEKEHTE